MKTLSFSSLVIAISVLWITVRIIMVTLSKKISWKREIQLLLVYICILVVVRMTFFAFHLVDGKIEPLTITFTEYRTNFTPLVHLFDYPTLSDLLLNVIGNCALFIPVGIILPYVYGKLNRFYKVLFAGALFSLLIEISQLIFTNRLFDVDDLVLNTFGCCIGYGIYCIVKTIKK